MRYVVFYFLFFLLSANILYAQTNNTDLKLTVDYANGDLLEFFHFENISYFKIAFSGGEELKKKSFCLRAKEYKDGLLVMDSVIIDSRDMPYDRLKVINDTVWKLNVTAKQIANNKMKIRFKFPAFSTEREFRTIETDDSYSLRVLAQESNLPIRYNENFYFLAYILPYDMGNGMKSFCTVGQNGADAENWGKKFGVKHFFLFEMKIE